MNSPVRCLDQLQMEALVAGSLSEEAMAAIDGHVDGCSRCRGLLARLARGLFDVREAELLASPSPEEQAPPSEEPADSSWKLRRGDMVADRYAIEERIGIGAMGVVYSARDTRLHRRVALKVLRTDALDPEGRAHARLLREAQTLAHVSHPNIVAVHDTGSWNERVFFVMEKVDGATLRDWLHETPRPSQDRILDVFAQAGRGLAAAHAVGLVHRDFKPDNVLMGNDGRVRVTDFGLAHRTASPEEERLASTPGATATSSRLSVSSLASHIVGTPSYMAPEQHEGKPADARSDQFAFCVALYEALYGERPFTANAVADLASLKRNGNVREPPRGRRASARIRAVVLRGLRPDAVQRFPSMNALCDALTARPRRGLRLLAAAAVAAVATSAAAYKRDQGAEPPACLDTGMELAGIWDASSKAKVQAAFDATGAPGAARAWAQVERSLDGYSARWAAERVDACEAAFVRKDQSKDMFDRRSYCLGEYLDYLKALVEWLERADARVVAIAPDVSSLLGDISRCTDARELVMYGTLPHEPDLRKRLEMEVRARIASMEILHQLGAGSEGLEIATAAAASAASIGWRPAEAATQLWLGTFQSEAGDREGAERSLDRALWAAEASGNDRAALEIWLRKAAVLSTQGRYPEALDDTRHAEALLQRVSNNAALKGDLLHNQGSMLYFMGKHEEARAALEGALVARREAFGAEHSKIASTVNQLGLVLQAEGRYREALDVYADALAMRRSIFGEEHSRVAGVLNNVGSTLQALGRLEEARTTLDRALAIRQKLKGSDDVEVALVLVNLADLDRVEGKYESGLVRCRHALEIQEGAGGKDSPAMPDTLARLGALLLAQGARKDAAAAYRRALAIDERALGARHPALIVLLTGAGEVELSRGAAVAALPYLERAVSLQAEGGIPPERAAKASFALARALWESGGDRARAVVLARAARTAYLSAEASVRRELEQVDLWLSRHPMR